MALEEDLEDASDAAEVLGEIFGGLPDVLQRTGSAAGATAAILRELAQAQAADASAAKIAETAGVSLAQAKSAVASAARAAATAETKAAKEAKEAQESTRASITSGSQAVASAIASVGTAALAIAFGPLPSAGEAMSKLGEMMGGAMTSSAHVAAEALGRMGPEGQAAGAALEGMAAIASATVGTLMTLAGVAIEVVEKLGLMQARFAALGGGEVMGAKTLAMVQQLGTSLPFATAQIGQWAMGLQRAGIQGNELESALKAVAAAEAIGEGGGEAASKMLKTLAEGGKGADTMMKAIREGGSKANKALAGMGLQAKDVGTAAQLAKMDAKQLGHAIEAALMKKGKGPLEEMGNSFPDIIGKAKEGFTSLFSDLGPAVKPFMAAVKSLFGEFNKGGNATKGLKPLVTGLFTTLFGWATKAVNVVHQVVAALTGTGKPGFLTTVVGLLKAIFTNALVLDGIKAIFTVIAVVIGVVIAVVGALAAVWGVVAAAVLAAVGYIADALGGIAGALSGFVGGAVDAAAGFVSGLVAGIVSGAGAVVDAVKGLAAGALGAFTSAFGIHSPSTVMLEHGEENIAGAAATGVDKGGAKVDRAMAKMGSGPKGGAAAGKSGATFAPQFNNCIFGGGLSQADVDEMMASWWERTAQGGPEAEAT